MRVKPLGFRPPPLTLDAEVTWVLQRAFGPLGWAQRRHAPGKRLLEVALRLDLAGRIAARQPRELVEREMGAAPAERLHEQFVATIAQGALLAHGLRELLAHAHNAHVPCILLKHAALMRLGVLRPGSRAACDIDVLVPHALARPFQTHLVRNGYQELGLPESSHQLSALQAPSGALVELHVHVPLITLAPGRPFAQAEDLMAAGLATESDGAWLPDAAILAAHGITHGLIQHSHAPHMCSPLRTFADLADLGRSSPSIVEHARPYLLGTMTAGDLASVSGLADALEKGDLGRAMDGGPGVLLRHVLASQLDHRYAIYLRLAGLVGHRGTSRRRSPAQLLNSLRAAWSWAWPDRSRAP